MTCGGIGNRIASEVSAWNHPSTFKKSSSPPLPSSASKARQTTVKASSPWLYLAGVECPIDAEVPDGWTKWVVPGYEYLAIENRRADTFSRMVDYFRENGLKLVGAVQEFTDPKTQQEYLYFPIRAL